MRLLLYCIVFFLFLPMGAAANALGVFVSIMPQKFLVERIGGDRVRVSVMLRPGHSPETYDPSLKQMARLASTRIYFLMGVPFESRWLEKFRLQNRDMRIVDTSSRCRKINHDPHVWTDPENARLIAAQIRDVLSAEDPASTPYYDANFNRLAVALDRLDAEIVKRLKDRRTDYFIVSHDAWGYYAARYGLRQLALESGGRERGPRGIAELTRQARREDIHVVFVQRQHPTGPAYTLAAELGARVVEIDPLAGDYIGNLRRVTASIAGALH